MLPDPARADLADLVGLRNRHQLLRAATRLIPADSARLDAEVLLAHAMGVSRLEMLLGSDELNADVLTQFTALIARRCRHEPVAQLVGTRDFWSLQLTITPDVLVPRPDSETLISEALGCFSAAPPGRILDLGTGSGALLLAALSEWREAFGIGIDRSAAAIGVARCNAGLLGFGRRAQFLVGNWAEALDAQFDLVLCNPPYIPDATPLMPDVAQHEPAMALFGGVDGLDAYRQLFPRLPGLLGPAGVALFEFGEGQAGALLGLAADAGLAARIANDLAGRPRTIVLRVMGAARIGLGKFKGSV